MNVISKLANKPVCFALFSNRCTRQHNTLSLSFLAVFWSISDFKSTAGDKCFCHVPPLDCVFQSIIYYFVGKCYPCFEFAIIKYILFAVFIDIILLLSTEFLSSIQNWWTWILREVHYSQPKSSVSRIEQNLNAR